MTSSKVNNSKIVMECMDVGKLKPLFSITVELKLKPNFSSTVELKLKPHFSITVEL